MGHQRRHRHRLPCRPTRACSVASPVSASSWANTWTFTEASAFDWAGNLVNLDRGGRRRWQYYFTVSNTGGYDLVKPALTSNKLIAARRLAVRRGQRHGERGPICRRTGDGHRCQEHCGRRRSIGGGDLLPIGRPSKCIVLTGSTATGVGSGDLKLKSQVSAGARQRGGRPHAAVGHRAGPCRQFQHADRARCSAARRTSARCSRRRSSRLSPDDRRSAGARSIPAPATCRRRRICDSADP